MSASRVSLCSTGTVGHAPPPRPYRTMSFPPPTHYFMPEPHMIDTPASYFEWNQPPVYPTPSAPSSTSPESSTTHFSPGAPPYEVKSHLLTPPPINSFPMSEYSLEQVSGSLFLLSPLITDGNHLHITVPSQGRRAVGGVLQANRVSVRNGSVGALEKRNDRRR